MTETESRLAVGCSGAYLQSKSAADGHRNRQPILVQDMFVVGPKGKIDLKVVGSTLLLQSNGTSIK